MVLAGVALGGCGAEPRLSGDAADRLRAGVDEVRGAGDQDGALRALEALRGRVDRAADAGRLADGDAAALRRGISRARRRVEREIAAPQPTPEPTVEATPEPTAEPTAEPAPEAVPAPPAGKKPEKGKGNGGFEGDDEGDEGDD